MHPEPNRRPSAVAISGIAATELAALATEGTIKGTGADSEAEAGGAIAAIDLFPSHAINIIYSSTSTSVDTAVRGGIT